MNLDCNSNNKYSPVIISVFIIFALLAVVSLFSHEAAGKLTVIPQSSSPYGKPYSNWTADWWRWYIQTPYRVVSSPFTVNFPAKNVFTATPPGPTTSVSDGYWIMFQPPSPGNHQIKFGGCYQSPAVSAPTEQPTGNFCQDVTYNLKVSDK